MIKSSEIKNFMNKLSETREEYCRMIEEKEQGEMTFSDKNTVKIWNDRVDHISKMIHELDMLEFDLFV